MIDKGKKNKVTGYLLATLLTGILVISLCGMAFAYITPIDPLAAGYGVYDFIVNKIIKGPIGTAIGIGLMALGAIMMFGQGGLGIAGKALGAAGILTIAPSIATGFGMII